jgi:hypothetical protein
MCVIALGKFNLAFENSIDYSYVTEKFFQGRLKKNLAARSSCNFPSLFCLLLCSLPALRAGTVPVQLGAPNIDLFSPTYGTNLKSYIRAKDFASGKELAEFLLMLDQDDEKYNEYLQWKKEPITEHFRFLSSRGMENAHGTCEMCKEVAKVRTLLKRKFQ